MNFTSQPCEPDFALVLALALFGLQQILLIGLALFRGNDAPGRDPHGEAFGDQPTLPRDQVQP